MDASLLVILIVISTLELWASQTIFFSLTQVKSIIINLVGYGFSFWVMGLYDLRDGRRVDKRGDDSSTTF